MKMGVARLALWRSAAVLAAVAQGGKVTFNCGAAPVTITLADTACGYGCRYSLPEGANGFTTIELKSNHLGTARDGHVDCVATPVHRGRTTQVWDATVTHRESGKALVMFRCTQMVLYPKG